MIKNYGARISSAGTVNDDGRLKGIFIKGLQESIRQGARNYWGKNPKAELQDLESHAESMESLLGDNPSNVSFDRSPRGGRRGGNTLVLYNDGGLASTSKEEGPSTISEHNSILPMQRAL